MLLSSRYKTLTLPSPHQNNTIHNFLLKSQKFVNIALQNYKTTKIKVYSTILFFYILLNFLVLEVIRIRNWLIRNHVDFIRLQFIPEKRKKKCLKIERKCSKYWSYRLWLKRLGRKVGWNSKSTVSVVVLLTQG